MYIIGRVLEHLSACTIFRFFSCLDCFGKVSNHFLKNKKVKIVRNIKSLSNVSKSSLTFNESPSTIVLRFSEIASSIFCKLIANSEVGF